MSSHLHLDVLKQEVAALRQRLQHSTMAHMALLTTLVHYAGGTIALHPDDFTEAKGLLLTQQVDQFTGVITFRTRRVGKDGGDEMEQSNHNGDEVER